VEDTGDRTVRSRLTRAGPVFPQKSLTVIELAFLLQADSSQAFRYLQVLYKPQLKTTFRCL
jgi:hypothetical protein